MNELEILDDTLFLDTIRQARSGRAANELGEALRELVGEVERFHSAGEFILSLKIKPDGKGQLIITDTFKVKRPTEPTGGISIWFVDEENNLRRDDPRQPNLPFKTALPEAKQA